MTLPSVLDPMAQADRAIYAIGRVRNAAFDAVQNLWRRRKAQGWTINKLATIMEKDPAVVCRTLKGPGNWRLQTFAEFVDALDGEVEISVHALEDPLPILRNHHAYAGYEVETDRRMASRLSHTSTTGVSQCNKIAAPNLQVSALAT